MPTRVIHTSKAPAAIGPYSQAVRVNMATADMMIFCSGQIGLDPVTGNLREGFDGQVDQALANMHAVINAADGSLSNIVKLTLYLTDLGQFAAVNAKLEAMLSKPYPARTTVGVAALPKGALFEIEAIVVL